MDGGPPAAAVSNLVARAREAREGGHLTNAREAIQAARRQSPEDESVLIEGGWCAHVAHDWPEAASWWGDVRRVAPHHVVGYVNGARVAMAMKQIEQAESLLEIAASKFPGNVDVAVEHAALASHRRQWDVAGERWSSVLARAGDIPHVWISAARSLREQRRFDEADAMLSEAATRFQLRPEIASERCWISEARGNWREAELRWAKFREDFPAVSAGWTRGGHALREQNRPVEADTLLQEAQRLFPDERHPLIDHAWLATWQRDWPAAASRWRSVRKRFPDEDQSWLREAAALVEAWQFDDAERLLSDGMKRRPDDLSLALEHAQLAMRMSQFEEALDRFAVIRLRRPHDPAAHLGYAKALRSLFRLAEANEALVEGQKLAPDNPELWLDHALLPVYAPLARDRNPAEALRRLAHVRERFPSWEAGYAQSIQVMRNNGRLDEASEVAGLGCLACPTSAKLQVLQASILQEQGSWGEARDCYADISVRFPNLPDGAIGQARAMALLGEDLESDKVLKGVIAKFPGVAAGYAAYAEAAMQRRDWPAAAVRCQIAAAAFPDDRSFVQKLYEVRLHLAGEADGNLPLPENGSAEGEPGHALRELVQQFESLGGRGLGCEFGMFQRDLGAEPLGLLRWADMPFEGIATVLENQFAGVGLPENTEVFVNRENGTRAEYCTRDLRGYMFMRCFVYEDEMSIKAMRTQALRRLVYLRDKLIADLKAHDKIFVWRCTERTLTDAEVARLHAALRSYGDNTLLYVQLADAGHLNGSVRIAADGLLIGYMDRFKVSPAGQLSSAPPTASWLRLCKEALRTVAKRS